MPIQFKDGDLFATPSLKAFAHGCNCAGSMGKGIAVAFRKRWPRMFAEYKRRCASGAFGLGDVFLWQEADESVFNLGTQTHWRAKATMDTVETSLTSMLALAETAGVEEIALPRVGAGLGGLRWDDVRALLELLAENTSVTLIVCENYVELMPMR
ncbi:MAG: macro domain-containing protein [Myxococcota bacterium]